MRIKKCCCCISLHTGCLIIAILSLISAVAVSFGAGDILTGAKHVDEESTEESTGNNQLSHQSNIMMKFIICVVTFLICFILLYGTIKKNRKMVMVWVVLMGCQCVLVFVAVIRVINVLRSVKGDDKKLVGGVLGGIIVQFIIGCYCWLVIWSRYCELRDEDKAAANINGPERAKLNDTRASSNC